MVLDGFHRSLNLPFTRKPVPIGPGSWEADNLFIG